MNGIGIQQLQLFCSCQEKEVYPMTADCCLCDVSVAVVLVFGPS